MRPNRLVWVVLVVLAWPGAVDASMRFRGRSIRDVVRESNTVSTITQQSGCPDAANTGEVHFTDLTESFDCDGDEGFTFTEATNLVNINEATDGDAVLLLLVNDLANTSGSTNETSQLRFGFGTDLDAARIIVEKDGDFSSAAQEYARFIFNVDILGTSTEQVRIANNSVGISRSVDPTNSLEVDGSIQSLTTSTVDVGVTPSGMIFAQSGMVIGHDQDPSDTQGSAILMIRHTTGSTSSAIVLDTPVAGAGPGLHFFTAGTENAAINYETIENGIGAFANARILVLGENYNATNVQSEDPMIGFGSLDNPVSITTDSGRTIATQRWIYFANPVINGVAGGATETCTTCANVYIEGPPTGSNITFTNGPYALWVDDGAVRFDGAVTYNSTQTATGDVTIQKADPSLIYDVTTATDTDFWAGVQDDAGSDDDDTYQIGTGTTPGSNVHLTIDTDGDVGIGNTDPAANFVVDFPTAQTIAAGNTVAADACGSIKIISSAGAVTTDTTNTFTAPAASNKGCLMHVCNGGANNITLDNNANFKSPAGADVVMTPDDCIVVGSTGASGVWYAMTALVAN